MDEGVEGAEAGRALQAGRGQMMQSLAGPVIHTLWSIYVTFKNRKDESMVIEVKRVESIFWREENFHILT